MLHNQPGAGFTAGMQASYLITRDPALTNNFTTSVAQEIGAVKAARRYRFIMPAHDDPGVLEDGR